MSKIGAKPIEIPSGTKVLLSSGSIEVSGDKGSLVVNFPNKIKVSQTDNMLHVERKDESGDVKAIHGTIRSLIYNAVTGVSKLWEKHLLVVGTGYKVKLQGEDLVFDVGYSHSVIFKKVPGISFAVEGNSKVKVSGVDKQIVGQTAHKIKIIKKPDPYKGKGIRYEGEMIKLKPGKKAKAAGGAK